MTTAIVADAGGILTGLGIILAAIGWFYKRGKNEQSLANSVDRNTEVTADLAAQVGGLRVTLESHTAILTEHHFRIKALEDREIKVTVK